MSKILHYVQFPIVSDLFGVPAIQGVPVSQSTYYCLLATIAILATISDVTSPGQLHKSQTN